MLASVYAMEDGVGGVGGLGGGGGVGGLGGGGGGGGVGPGKVPSFLACSTASVADLAAASVTAFNKSSSGVPPPRLKVRRLPPPLIGCICPPLTSGNREVSIRYTSALL